MKPELPKEIQSLLPQAIIYKINSYVPHLPKPKPPSMVCSYSPELAKNLQRIQQNALKGKNNMYLRELDDFVLDR